ncbi:MAG: phosphoribosyltransferase family protein [Sphingobacteriia bacterium]|jgi:ComF family protein
MISSLRKINTAIQHLLYPHFCCGCGVDFIGSKEFLCAKCNSLLPLTLFSHIPFNPIEKILIGRLPLVAAGSMYYFTKSSLLQHLLVQLKYNNNKEVGYFFGRQLGQLLKDSNRFNSIDCIVSLPLHPKKEYQRGYNQAELIADGMSSVWQKKVLKKGISRLIFTKTQTQESRISRWENMEGVFEVRDPDSIRDKHVLLIDDVITTGASLEACGAAILAVPGTRLSIATVAYTI